jgi:sugar/nucleoside kinase (ribokinase family)
MWVVVQEAIRAATLVIVPARLDLAAVRETVTVARRHNKPYAVVVNAAPVKRDERDTKTEIARLWSAIERSVDAINSLKAGSDVA